MSYIPEPITRIDKYLAYIAGNMDVALPDYPITRKEHYLAAWAEKSGFEDVDVAGEPPLTLENGIGKPLKGLKIYGRSMQKTTTGAQLLDYDNLMPDIAYGMNGILQSNKGYVSSQLIKVTGNSPYTISGLGDVAVIILQYSSEKVLLSRKASSTNGTYTTLKDVCYIGLTFYAGVTVDMLKNVMLNAGSAPLPWEPYTGGKPSPSPDYPQEIESVGQGKTIGINVRGKNLLNPLRFFSGRTDNGVTWNVKNNGEIVCEGTASENSFLGSSITYPDARWLKIPAGTYVLSGSSEHVVVYINVVSLSGDRINTYYSERARSVRCVFTEDVYISMQAMVRNGETAAETVRPQFELGDTATPYEPYHESQSIDIATPNGLPGIIVGSGGNYIDATGTRWICDEIDLARGMYVQRIYRNELNSLYVYLDGLGMYVVKLEIETLRDAKVMCNVAQYKYSKEGNGCYAIGNILVFGVEYSLNFQTVEEFRTMLQEKSAIAYTVLATPIETSLTDEQIVAYKALHTYKGTTIIDNDAGAYMSVKYEKMK